MKLKLEDKINIIAMLEVGHSQPSLAKKYNISLTAIKSIIRQYREHGIESFKPKGKNVKYPPDFKLEVVKRVLIGESKRGIAAELCVNVGMIFSWVKKYQELGYNGLTTRQGRPRKMKPENNQSKKTTTPMDEKDRRIKELEEKNAQLEMENDLLKKLRALVQQRTQQPKDKK